MSVKKYAPFLLIDAILVIIFCAIGRRTHEEANALAGLAKTSWPFLTGLVIGWAATFALYRDKFNAVLLVPTGVVVWLGAVVFGMILRVLSGQGTQFSFIVVATLVLGAFLLGWRALAPLVVRIRTKS
ncbi:lipopolysaccharide export LptBFGC system permease protein LptF [Rhodococcus sp. 27YEA6]